ncbi:neuronal PAS domain-containing protein 4 isoform X4 [Columba livia]|uniref:neuronal PAS domain-containing protein 4 isoform X4 n=1 Tax=Columba livia TaxID=8932 RepID=UPI0031BB2A1D
MSLPHVSWFAILIALGGKCCASPSLDTSPQSPGFAGQPRVPPRLAGTRSTWSCRHCAPCCPSLHGRRSGSPTSTPWPWCASSCGGLSCSPQVELLAQGDTVFDILDGQAHEDVRKQLLLAQEEPGREVTFVGEMHTSKAFRLRHGGNRAVAVHGHFAALGQPASSTTTVFLALCTLVARLPTDGDAGSHDDLFQSTHILDMTFTDVTESVTYHLGYRREELIGQSWYSLLHPEDADLAAAQHRAVARGAGATAGTAVLRVLRRDRTWAWLRVSARRDSGGHSITCTSHCLREEEAAYLRARQHRRPPRTAAAPPPAPAAVPPPGRELSLLAAQLRALADSLSPPATATRHPLWPGPEPLRPGAHDTALGRLPGSALEGAESPAAHAHCAPYARQ